MVKREVSEYKKVERTLTTTHEINKNIHKIVLEV